jgi:phage terminase small subunit
MGRPRIPTAIQEAKGAFIHDPQRARPLEPKSDKSIGSPPKNLSPTEKAEWKSLVKQIPPGVLKESDRLMFGLLVRLASKLHSGAAMMVGETNQLISLSGKFALTPADRSKVSVEQPKKSELGDFLARQRSLRPPDRPSAIPTMTSALPN